jgi:UDPglucose 6-dehydrogenase
VLLDALIGAGARVKAYDPVAMPAAQAQLPKAWFDSGQLELTKHQYEALEQVDAMVLVTEWKPFRHPDFSKMKRAMKSPVIFDGRNQYDPETLRADGFEYSAIGR